MMNDDHDESNAMGDDESRLQFRNPSTFRSYLELMRVPNVFTAMADVVMGFLFVQAGPQWQPTHWDFATLATLIAASSLLYIAGMVLNDAFDVDIDRQERPERPIPSGRISLASASRLGWRLLVLGVAVGACAVFFTGHLRSGVVAAILATAILLYDAWLKRTPLGPVAMGACRTLNVMLGMSAVEVSLHAEYWIVAGAIGVYVAGLTWFARKEAGEREKGTGTFCRNGPTNLRSVPGAAHKRCLSPFPVRLQLSAAAMVMLLGIATLVSLPHWTNRLIPELFGQPRAWYVIAGINRWYVLILLMSILILRRFLFAVADPTPGRVRLAVSQGILSIVMLDAVACYAVRGVLCATMILLLMLPAVFFGRRIETT
jgi:4-hydroxybenzoate polyprenyltransferase